METQASFRTGTSESCRIEVRVLPWLAVLIGLISLPAPLSANTCTVDTTSQDDLIYFSGSGLDITLRMSLRHALASTACDNISITARGTISLTSALPTIDRNLTISGPGFDSLTVRTEPNRGDFRIFTITAWAAVSISGMEIADGLAAHYDTFGINRLQGGGIWNGGTLTVTNCALTNNVAATDGIGSQAQGAAIWNEGTLTVRNCSFGGNQIQVNGTGGAIGNSGTLTVADSTFSSNQAIWGGGAIYNSPTGHLTVMNSTFTGNQAFFESGFGGGAIFNDRGLTEIRNSTFTGNRANQGGAISNLYGDLTLSGSTFYGNIELRPGGNGFSHGGGGILNDEYFGDTGGRVAVTNSVFIGNRAEDADGGAILNGNTGTLSVINSTFSGNGSLNNGGGLLTGPNATIINNTFSDNFLKNSAPGGAGIFIHNSGAILLNNIFVANRVSNTGGASNNCYVDQPLPPGGNLSSDDTCPAAFRSVDPQLGPLADNDGPTLTRSLLPISPALNAGLTSNCPGTDQRGVSRPQGTGCDIGAYEAKLTFTCPALYALLDVNGSSYSPFYTSTMTASGGTSPYTYSLLGGSLPGGFSFSPSGTISGTPTALGTYNFTVKAVDASGPLSTATNNCSIIVVTRPLVASGCPNLTGAQAAVNGVPLSTPPLSGAAGTGGPYTFTVDALPPSLTMASNGSITGTPTVDPSMLPTHFPYSITVRDRDNNTGITNCRIEVDPAPLSSQTITVTTPAPPLAAYRSTFTVAATAPGGTVAYSSSGACTNVGATFTMNSGTGTCTVMYNQAGNNSYNPAPQVTSSTTASKANQTITFTTPAPASAAYNSSFPLVASSDSGMTVVLSADASSASVCSLSGSTVSMLSGTGTCKINANQSGDGNYSPAAQTQTSAAATKLDQTLTLNAASPLTYQTSEPLSTSGSTGTGAVTFSLTSGSCSISAGQLTANSGTGSCVIGATKSADGNYNEATASATVTLQKASQTITFALPPSPATYGTTFDVAASSNSNLAVSIAPTGGCSISNGTVTMISGTTACTLTASQTGDNNYSAATDVVRTVIAGKASQNITFVQPASPATYGTTFNVAASSNSNLAVVIAAAGGCSISNGTVTMISGTTTCTLTASQAGNSNYLAAGDVIRTVQAAKANLTITADQKNKLYLAALPALTATYSGFKGSDTPAVLSGTLTCGTTATQTTLIGNYPITCSGQSSASYNISYVGSQLTIAALPVTAGVTLSSVTTQYSDKITINVSIPNLGGVPPAGGLNFKTGSVDLGTATLTLNGANYTGSVTSPQLMQTPGAYTITGTFVTPDADYILSYSPAPLLLTVTAEDARSVYTGPAYVNTPSVTTYTATIPLSFTIQDITAVGRYVAGTGTTPASGDQAYDGWVGNINNATVKIIDGLTNTTMCATTTLGVISAGDTATVTATCSFTANLPTSGAGAGFQTYAPQVTVSGHYLDSNSVSEQGLLTVALPLTSNFVSAGGGIAESASSGLLPAAYGSKSQFGLNVKYNKSGTSLQGNAYVTVRSTVVAPGDTCPADTNGFHVYRFKSNSITSLTAQTSVTPSTAILVGGASVQDITATGTSTCSYSVDGGATLQITMTDKGNTGDSIGIAVWQAVNKGGNLWFSSSWAGGKTTELPLVNGSVSVH